MSDVFVFWERPEGRLERWKATIPAMDLHSLEIVCDYGQLADDGQKISRRAGNQALRRLT